MFNSYNLFSLALFDSAPPNGLSSDEAGSSTVVNAPAIPLSASPSLSQVQRSTTLEEILTQGAKEGGPATMVKRMEADSASLELTLSSQSIDGAPAAKRMRLDSIEGRKDESKPCVCVCVCVRGKREKCR